MNACTGMSFQPLYKCSRILLLDRIFLILSPNVCSDCCKTSFFDMHRSCPSCHNDPCLQCCQELRDGNLQGNKEEFVNSGYLYGRGLLEDVKRSTRGSASAAPKDQQFLDSMSAAYGFQIHYVGMSMFTSTIDIFSEL